MGWLRAGAPFRHDHAYRVDSRELSCPLNSRKSIFPDGQRDIASGSGYKDADYLFTVWSLLLSLLFTALHSGVMCAFGCTAARYSCLAQANSCENSGTECSSVTAAVATNWPPQCRSGSALHRRSGFLRIHGHGRTMAGYVPVQPPPESIADYPKRGLAESLSEALIGRLHVRIRQPSV
jgi:hypothetical protein